MSYDRNPRTSQPQKSKDPIFFSLAKQKVSSAGNDMVELSLLAKEAETLQKEIYEALRTGATNVYVSLHLTKEEVTGRNGKDGTVKAFGFVKGPQQANNNGGQQAPARGAYQPKQQADYQKKQQIRNRVEQLKKSSLQNNNNDDEQQ